MTEYSLFTYGHDLSCREVLRRLINNKQLSYFIFHIFFYVIVCIIFWYKVIYYIAIENVYELHSNVECVISIVNEKESVLFSIMTCF